MNLPKPPAQYDADHQAQAQRIIEVEDRKNIKHSDVLDKLKFRDTATGTIRTVVVTSGAFVIT